LLTFFSIATAYASFKVMRTISLLWPVMLGLSLAGAIYTKTLGVLNILVPLFAVLLLVPRYGWPRKAFGVGIGYLIAAIVVLPLVPWIPQLYGRASEFADVGSGGGAGAQLGLQLLSSNMARASLWAMDYFKAPFLLAAAVGGGYALVRRDRASLFVLITLVVPTLALLDRATILFSRYFMFAIYPAYILAALGLVELGRSFGLMLSAERRWPATLVASGLSMGGLIVILGTWFTLSVGILVAPAAAALTIEDHLQYVEDWYALFGLGTVADLIRLRAGPQGATVVEPVRPWWYNPRMPEDALHYYLWDESRVRFVESQALLDAENLCDLRSWTTHPEPVFLVIDGAAGSGDGAPPGEAAYTQRLAAGLARDLPEASEVLRIPRPNAGNWLSVVQLNAGRSPSAASACQK
jgi:hypothetical protein